MKLAVYLLVIAASAAGAGYFYKDRLRLVAVGITLVVIGTFILIAGVVPNRQMDPFIIGAQAKIAGLITIICGVILLLILKKRWF